MAIVLILILTFILFRSKKRAVKKVTQKKKTRKSRPMLTGFVTLLLGFGTLEVLKYNGKNILGYREIFTSIMNQQSFVEASEFKSFGKVVDIKGWPPILSKEYSDIQLIDSKGNEFNLKSFEGSPVIIELIGMTCVGRYFFSGGNSKKERLAKIKPQKGLKAFATYYKTYTKGLKLFNGPVKLIQLLTYDLDDKQTKPEDAKLWSEHFYLDGLPENVIIAIPKKSMISSAT